MYTHDYVSVISLVFPGGRGEGLPEPPLLWWGEGVVPPNPPPGGEGRFAPLPRRTPHPRAAKTTPKSEQI